LWIESLGNCGLKAAPTLLLISNRNGKWNLP
jgi:hypothetical protein